MTRRTAVKVVLVVFFFPALLIVNLWLWSGMMSGQFSDLQELKPDTNRVYRSSIELTSMEKPEPMESLDGLSAPGIQPGAKTHSPSR